MSDILDYLKERIQAAFPGVDLDSAAFEREFEDPVTQYLGLDTPSSDPTAILRARVSEEFPQWKDSVLADLFGRQAALISMPIRAEIAAARSRRRLDDERILSGSDLEDARSTWLTEPEGGRFSKGTWRAYFTTPRNITIDTVNRIEVPATGSLPVRLYRPSSSTSITSAQMRNQVDAGRYYLDFDAEATEPGPDHDLELGQGRGALGITGAVLITNITRFEGGVSADDPQTYLARITSGNRLRSASTPGGLENTLQTLGLTRFVLIEPGDARLVRDRVYGPGFISGIPGGFKRDYSQSSPPFTSWISLGIAHDVWTTATEAVQVSAVKISALRDEGMILVTGDIGQFQYDGASPETDHPVTAAPLVSVAAYTEHIIISRAKSFGLVIADPKLYLSGAIRHSWSAFPVEAGDIVEREGWANVFTGIRSRMLVVTVGTGMLTAGQKTIVRVLSADIPNVTANLWRFRALRINAQWWDPDRMKFAASINPHTSLPWMAIPLARRRAVGPTGDVVTAGGQPALTVPGTITAESIGGSPVPITSNLIEQDSPQPISWLSRAELMDPLTGQPADTGSRNFIYPAKPMLVEFREPRHGDAAVKGSTPVRVRFHLFGPQAMAPSPVMTLGINNIDPDVAASVPEGYDHINAGADYAAPVEGNPVIGKNQWRRYGPYRAPYWPKMAYTATPLNPSDAETGRLVVTLSGGGGALLTSRQLLDFNSEPIYDDSGPRLIREGDWAIMIPRTGSYAWADAAITDNAGWPATYPQTPDYTDAPENEWFKICRAFPIVQIEDDDTLVVAAEDIPTAETGDLWIIQGTSRAQQLLAGRGEEGTYFADIFFARYTSLADAHVIEHPPLGTLAQWDPAELYAQGFHLYSSNPGLFYSPEDDATLIFPSGYVNDGEELDGRSIQIYGPSGADIEQTQQDLSDPSVRPMTNSVLTKQMPPIRLTLAVYYDAADLDVEAAVTALLEGIEASRVAGVFELSDLAAAMYTAGADYVSTGRAFVHAEDHLRGQTISLKRGAIPLAELGDLVPEALAVRRLDSTARANAIELGQDFIETDSVNWQEETVYRFGDYGED